MDVRLWPDYLATEAARRTIEGAGFSGRAEFIQGNSFEMDLPERVDLIVCDHIGYFGFDYGVLELLADAEKGRL